MYTAKRESHRQFKYVSIPYPYAANGRVKEKEGKLFAAKVCPAARGMVTDLRENTNEKCHT
jgi:hypothetical protein